MNKKRQQEQLAKEWQALQEKHAQYQPFSARNKNHRQPGRQVDLPGALSKKFGEPPRTIENQGVRISSVRMGTGAATVRFDPSLEEAKRALRGRTGQLFNKGGMQFMTDQDLADLAKGTNRKHA